MWEPFYILPQGLMNVLEVFTRQCTLNLEESRNILLINECFSNGNTRREMELGTNAIVEAKKNIDTRLCFGACFYLKCLL